jgi:methyl-accepting chemotaxis protein
MSSLIVFPAVQALQGPTADTVYMMMPRDGLATAEAVSSIVVAAGLVVLFLLALVLLLQLRRLSKMLGSVAKNLERNADPVLDRARSVAENVDFIAASVRTDIQKLNESVGRITDRLNQASDRVEARVEDFNALIEVVQAEAEDIFLDTAATVRGVRIGARTLGNGEGSPGEAPVLEAGGGSAPTHSEVTEERDETEEGTGDDATPEDAAGNDDVEGKEG